MNKEAIELIEQKKRFCENMIEIETNYENQVYKDMVKENRIFDYILKILKENENSNLKQALNEIRKYINNKQIGEEHFGNELYMFETKYGKHILKIIDETLRGEN